jgi:hypothetical protein
MLAWATLLGEFVNTSVPAGADQLWTVVSSDNTVQIDMPAVESVRPSHVDLADHDTALTRVLLF